jgi:formylglycine-generating enzyme required for sulfatase activity
MNFVFYALLIGAAFFAALTSNAGEISSKEFKDCTDCPTMVEIPAGSFEMGGKPVPEVGFVPESEELPRRLVRVAKFAIGKYEITQSQWVALMGENPSDYDDHSGVLPVETVSWIDAQEFVRRLSKKTGRRYRLPTEAEWEYAALAGSDTLFAFGNDEKELDKYAWYSANSGGHIHQVGTKLANAFGLHDIHGNVWEWVEDCYFPTYEGAPTDGRAAMSQPGCQRNNRGGSWVNTPLNLRASHRHKMGAGSRGTFIGIRVAATVDQ